MVQRIPVYPSPSFHKCLDLTYPPNNYQNQQTEMYKTSSNFSNCPTNVLFWPRMSLIQNQTLHLVSCLLCLLQSVTVPQFFSVSNELDALEEYWLVIL